ncbi:MAG TPA: hypothetical protein VG273_08490 [Bryobacteraceae bacterium]|jgi:hypothetical protein|nr:hypothetical protein [Bryobacteraceae bacterium]
MSPLLDYQARLSVLETALATAHTVRLTTLFLLGATVLLLFLLTWLALEHRVPLWNAALPLPIAGAAVRRYAKNRSALSRVIRLQNFYRKGIERLEYRFAGMGHSGEEFQVPGHPYESDLNLFGHGSIFELLCTARTQMGRRRLASWLLDTPDLDEAKARQDAVRELSARTALREEIALLGKFEFRDSSEETFCDWLNASSLHAPHPAIQILALVTSVLLGAILIYGYFALPLVLASWIAIAPAIGALIAVNAAIGIALNRRSAEALSAAARMSVEAGVLREGLALLQRQQFESAKLQNLQHELSQDDAAHALHRLEKMTAILDDCDHPAFYLFARLLLVRTQLWFAMERWRSIHGEALRRWMKTWAEFEALAAISGYAWEHPADSYPEFVEDETIVEFRAAGHPVLPAATCVRNDFDLGKYRRFYLISGSNMAGKSTLLRAVGLNVVLAGVGAPVRAASLRLSCFALCASLAVVDSLSEGKSKFQAEISRLRLMMESARAGTPVLFLIDEILSGTNSRDRRIAAESVIRGLVERGAVGALSTHDLALTEIAELEALRGTNVHMGARSAADPLDFDYKLKPGVIQASNAIAIARMAGVLT